MFFALANVEAGKPSPSGGGLEVQDGIFVAGNIVRAELHGIAVVVHAVGDEDPAVVLAGLNAIHFVAAARTKFGFPQFAGDRMNREAKRIAMTDRVDLRSI